MTTFTARVSEHELLGGSFQYTRLELVNPNHIEFQSGQYVIITVDREKGIRRDYSIASPASMNHAIDILVDIKPAGNGSLYLAHLAPGDEIKFTGPFGSFVVDDNKTGTRGNPPAGEAGGQGTNQTTEQELIFVATGSGISPIRSMIVSELVDRKSQKAMRLWWGMRYEEDCFWSEDFDDLEKEHPNFQWDLVLSKPPDEWPLHSGYVTTHVLDYVKNKEEGRGKKEEGQTDKTCFYLCGSRQMIEDVSVGLTNLGVSHDKIRYEKFF